MKIVQKAVAPLWGVTKSAANDAVPAALTEDLNDEYCRICWQGVSTFVYHNCNCSNNVVLKLMRTLNLVGLPRASIFSSFLPFSYFFFRFLSSLPLGCGVLPSVPSIRLGVFAEEDFQGSAKNFEKCLQRVEVTLPSPVLHLPPSPPAKKNKNKNKNYFYFQQELLSIPHSPIIAQCSSKSGARCRGTCYAVKAALLFTTGSAFGWTRSLMEIGTAHFAFVQRVPIRTSDLGSTWYLALLEKMYFRQGNQSARVSLGPLVQHEPRGSQCKSEHFTALISKKGRRDLALLKPAAHVVRGRFIVRRKGC